VSAITSALAGIAVFALGAPPIILIPAVLITGTINTELKTRARHRHDGR